MTPELSVDRGTRQSRYGWFRDAWSNGEEERYIPEQLNEHCHGLTLYSLFVHPLTLLKFQGIVAFP